MNFSFKQRALSFRYAFKGLGILLKSQHNARIHLVATIGVISAGLVLNISRTDWCWLVVALILVWVAEAFNTALAGSISRALRISTIRDTICQTSPSASK